MMVKAMSPKSSEVEVYILEYSITIYFFAMLGVMTSTCRTCFNRPPSQDDVDIVREFLYRPASKNPPTISLSHDYILYYESLLLLRDGRLLNDEVLEAFLKLLEAKYSVIIEDHIIFNTRLYTKLTTNKTYNFDLVKTYVHIL